MDKDNKKYIPFKLGLKILGNSKNENYWNEIHPGSYKIDRPILLCLGGITTTRDKDASYVGGFINRLVTSGDLVDVISLAHSHYEGEASARYFDEDPAQLDARGIVEATELSKIFFDPLIKDKDGNSFSLEQTAKNLRQINIFAHCYGYFSTVRYLEEVLKLNLDQLGYNDAEKDFLTQQVFVAAYEPGSIYKTGFSNFSLSSMNSDLWKKENQEMLLSEDFETAEMFRDEKEKILSSKVFENPDETTIDKFFRENKYLILKQQNKIDLFTGPLTYDNTDHALETLYRTREPDYSHVAWGVNSMLVTDTGDCASQTLGMAIATACVNSMHNFQEDAPFEPLDMGNMFETCDNIMAQSREFFGTMSEFQVPEL